MAVQVSPTTRKICWARERGACAKCRRQIVNHPHDLHHRDPRGMGGTSERWRNLPANLLYLCDECHDEVESDRTMAQIMGWLLLGTVTTPSEAPVYYQGQWSLLDDKGGVTATKLAGS